MVDNNEQLNGANISPRKPHSLKGRHLERATCRHCGQSVARISLSRHEKLCAAASPKIREFRREQRSWADQRRARETAERQKILVRAAKNGFRHIPRMARAATETPLGAPQTGQRVSVTVSVDFEALRAILSDPRILASLKLDAVFVS